MSAQTMEFVVETAILNEGIAACKASVASILDATLTDAARASLDEAIIALHDAGDLVRIEMVRGSAVGARCVSTCRFFPSDRYLDVFAAAAGNRDGWQVELRHGWPILSFDGVPA